MFNLALIDDTIKIEASQLGLDTVSALTYNINAKYSNRILPNVGLCFSHFDYSSISEGVLRNGDGCTYYKVTFRLVVFRPFKGEVLVGKVVSSDETGIRVSMGFFEDIYLSSECLPSPSAYDVKNVAWFWVQVEEGQDHIWEDPHTSIMDQRFYIEKEDVVRFLVEGDEFSEPDRPGPKDWAAKAQQQQTPGQMGGAEMAKVNTISQKPVYKVKASIAGNGLGPLSWWKAVEGAEPVVE